MAVMRRRSRVLDARRNAGDEEAFLDFVKRLVAK